MKNTVKKYSCARCFPWRQKNSEVKYAQNRISGGGFLENASHVRQRKRDIWVRTSNIKSLYRAVSLTVAARELDRYKLNLVGVQEVRSDKGAQYEQGTIISSMERDM